MKPIPIFPGTDLYADAGQELMVYKSAGSAAGGGSFRVMLAVSQNWGQRSLMGTEHSETNISIFLFIKFTSAIIDKVERGDVSQ